MKSTSSLIASRAVIAVFQTGAWRTIKRHAAETKAENARHGLTDEARVDVKICSHPLLTELQRIQTEARTEHYRLTLPAADDGFRLLPGKRQLEHSQMMQTYGATFQQTVAKFADIYDQVRADAPRRLNGLYIASQWPDRETVRSAFRLQVRYLPVPALGEWDEWMAESAASAQDELKGRLGEAIRKIATKLGEPDAIFRDSLIGNLAEILDLADDLNISEDPAITRLAKEARSLAVLDPDTLREDAKARADNAKKAADLCSMFSL